MDIQCLKSESDLRDIYRRQKYLKEFKASHPNYFNPIGTMIFCGKQGKGKTLSAVKYTRAVLDKYPFCILVSNVSIKDRPFNARYSVDKDGKTHLFWKDTGEVIFLPCTNIVIEYDGLDCLKYISNGYHGVFFLIDELHLELNSLESKNIDIDVITEISQQRKQRKHIVGTSQVYMRLAKPLREQIFNIVLCDQLFFPWLQYNKLIDGEESKEKDGKLDAVVRKRVFWIHKPEDYEMYDTFAKMKRYNKEWKGHKREDPNIYKRKEVFS